MLSIETVRFDPPDADREGGTFVVARVPDWINVVALTPDRELVLVRQFRFGVERETLEIPGGMCDPGEAPIDAARRELREETGYAGERWHELGSVEPNPALQDNRCHTFLAEGATPAHAPAPDPHESIEVVLKPWAEVAEHVRRGEITHALVVAALYRYGLWSDPPEPISTR